MASPKDFWALHPTEYWWLAELNRPRKMYGDMTEEEVEAIYRETYGDEA